MNNSDDFKAELKRMVVERQHKLFALLAIPTSSRTRTQQSTINQLQNEINTIKESGGYRYQSNQVAQAPTGFVEDEHDIFGVVPNSHK